MNNSIIANQSASVLDMTKTSVDMSTPYQYTVDQVNAVVWQVLMTLQQAQPQNIDSLIDITGMLSGGRDMPRQRVITGQDDNGEPIRKCIQAKNMDELNDRIVLEYIRSGRIDELMAREREKKKTKFKVYAQLWLEDMKRKRKEKTTLKTYRSALNAHILPAFGEKYIEDITWQDIQAWLDEREERAKSSVKQYLTNVKSILDLAVEDKLIDQNPARSVHLFNPATKETKRKALTPAQMQSIMQQAEGLDRLDQCMLALYLTTGMRKGEVLALRWEDIDFDKNVIHIRHQTTYDTGSELRPPKRGSVGDVPLVEWTKEILLRYKKDSGFIMVATNRAKPLSGSGYNNRFKRLKEKIELYGATGHCFRHSAITAVHHSGADMTTLKDFARHKTLTVTLNTYTHEYKEDTMNVGKAFDEIFQKNVG